MNEFISVEARNILEDNGIRSGEKLERLSLHVPICQAMLTSKAQGHFWKLILEDVCVLLIQQNLDLQEQILIHNQKCTIIKVPMMGIVK